MNPACSAADALGMTADYLTRASFPPDDDNVRRMLYKVITLPSNPRVPDEVYLPNGKFAYCTKLRFREDQRIEVFLEDLWPVLNWDTSGSEALYQELLVGGYTVDNPWEIPE